MQQLVSFDIDGTLELGDPPGPIGLDVVRAFVAAGAIVGSASDRPTRLQQDMWTGAGIVVHFVTGKHRLGDVLGDYGPLAGVHIGDTEIDEHFARLAGLAFLDVAHAPEVGTDGLVAWVRAAL